MTKAEFKRQMGIWGDRFMNDSCCELQLEIIKKIVNCKNINDFNKLTLVKQYTKDLVTNNSVVEAIKEYNKR